MREIIWMKCNCVADATRNGQPCCAVHSTMEQISPPDLSNRKAKCSYGHKIVASNGELAFFRYHPTEEYDEYYCGCFGWD